MSKDFRPCRPWKGRLDKRGYGRAKHGPRGKRRDVLAHRLAYCEAHGLKLADIKGIGVCHSCDNPPCVEPGHLFLGDQARNLQDMAAKDRSTHSEKNPMAKLTKEKVREIRQRYARGDVKQKTLAMRFGVSVPAISQVVNNRSWTRV